MNDPTPMTKECVEEIRVQYISGCPRLERDPQALQQLVDARVLQEMNGFPENTYENRAKHCSFD